MTWEHLWGVALQGVGEGAGLQHLQEEGAGHQKGH